MSYSKFFQSLMLGFTAFAMFWNYELSDKQKNKEDSVSESWNNVGKYLNKAVNDYAQTLEK